VKPVFQVSLEHGTLDYVYHVALLDMDTILAKAYNVYLAVYMDHLGTHLEATTNAYNVLELLQLIHHAQMQVHAQQDNI